MDRVEKMRKKQAEKHGTRQEFENLFPPVQPTVSVPAAVGVPPEPGAAQRSPPPGKKPKAPATPKVMVEFRCHHKKPIEAFKGTDCGECRHKMQKDRAHRQRQKHVEGVRHPIERGGEQRLPDGAQFVVEYSEKDKEWCGELKVPHEGDKKRFSGEAGGVEKLLRNLARQCWDWLAQQ